MENNFENFIKYRARLRYKHFNNNKYNNMSDFRREQTVIEKTMSPYQLYVLDNPLWTNGLSAQNISENNRNQKTVKI